MTSFAEIEVISMEYSRLTQRGRAVRSAINNEFSSS